MKEKAKTFELIEPTSPEVLIPHSPVEPWMIIVGSALLLIIVVLAIFYFRKKSKASTSQVAAREAAYAEATSALQAIGDVPAREAAVRASLIIRKYLSLAAGDPALFETHEEFLSRDKALSSFSDEAREATSSGFSTLAAMKYSAETPRTGTGEVVETSIRLLETLHQGFRA